jgi:hypothetical protein
MVAKISCGLATLGSVVWCPGMEAEVVGGRGSSSSATVQGYLVLLIVLHCALPTNQRNCQHLPPKEDQVSLTIHFDLLTIEDFRVPPVGIYFILQICNMVGPGFSLGYQYSCVVQHVASRSR